MAMITGVNDIDIQSFEKEDSVVSDQQAIGSFNLNTSKIKLVNLNKQYDSLKGTWLSTIFGKQYVNDAKSKQGDVSIELECYDLAYAFDKEFSSSEVENSRSKNIFDVQKYYTGISDDKRDAEVSISNGNISWTNTSSDSYFPALWNYGAFPLHKNDAIKVEPNTTYTLSFVISNNIGNGYVYIYEGDADHNGVNNSHGASLTTTSNVSCTFTTSATTEYIIIRFARWESTHHEVTISNIQLEKGSSATNFTPYRNGFSYPATTKDWLLAICDVCKVELATPTFPNSDIVLDRQPYLPDGASYRDAVREIAGSAGCFAQIIDDKLHIKWFDNTTTTASDWFELTQGEQVPAVNTVVLGRGDLEDNIVYPSPVPENPYELRIDDNQILLDHEQDAIVPIYNNVVGFDYRIFKLRFIGLRNLRAGQKITYIDIDGDTVTTPVMSNTIKFLGGDYTDPNAFESEVESVQLKETNTTYKYAGTITKTVRRTEAHVNKIDGDIQLITEDVQHVWDEFDNYYTMGQSNTLVQNAVDGLMNTFSNSGGNNLIKNSSLYFGSEDNYDYWDGNLVQVQTDLSSSKKALSLKAGTVTQNISGLVNGYVSLRLSYKKVGTGLDTSAKLILDGVEYNFDEAEGTIEITKAVTSGVVVIAFNATDNNEFIVYDLMLNYGNGVYLPYQQAQNELKSTQVSISQEIKVESNVENTVTTIGANGLVGTNKSTNEVVFKQTDTGSYSKHIETESAKISDLTITKVGDQVWISGT